MPLIQSRRTESTGFTLLEVLVALAVVAVALAALLKGVSSSALNEAYLRDKNFAHWVAMNVVAERQLGLQQEALLSDRGEVEMGGQRWQWRARLLDTFDAAIWRLEVEVRPVDGEDETVLARLVAFLPRPEGEER
ncbi:MAG: type II secretion system minor pseudopilin GspI [Gammaproteobacteria bacterium]|nr:type II secretion system minor pseudopilin GspI [Gammaproteobacteria bacterium]MCW9089056.1 type II secretion system minor pseudopilin GspI [Gammaproteobacteria bacterium]